VEAATDMANVAHNHPDYRDLAIETLSDENDQLTTRVIDLMSERDSYRELAHRSIAALQASTMTHDRLREQHRRLVDEYGALREQILRDVRPEAA
jgi:hypothetical protein